MKKDDFKKLKTKSDKELKKTLDDWCKEAINMKFKLKMGKLKNPHELTEKKRDIARVKTLLRERELTETVSA
jgi:large subunit ribosomal protein L29